MAEKVKDVFSELSKIKCKIEKKGRFNYVSWTQAWGEVKKRHPDVTFKVYETDAGFPAFVKPSLGGFVKVGVTINDQEYIEHYPILDYMNKAIKPEFMTVFDINTAIKRAMVKALAYFGLGLYVYDGEDLPPGE